MKLLKVSSSFAIVLAFNIASQAAEKPNIVLIIADDLGWSDVGYNGAEFYETPNIDALCESGMKFNDAYPGASNCMPSRSCILTGMYTPRTQMWTPGGAAKGKRNFMKFLVPTKGTKGSGDIFASKTSVDSSVTSIAEVLNSGGYRTARFGKWHLGQDTQGFDISDPSGRGGKIGSKYYGNKDVAEWLTDASIEFISENKKQPFFLYLAHWDVHTPIRARSDVVSKYRNKLESKKWDWNWNPTYAAMVEAVDRSVGRVKDSLEMMRLMENTLFVFTSDNGGHAAVTRCAPLKGAKGAFYEGGIRVPTCMSWPGTIATGSLCDTPITGVDFLPTFAELAGLPVPETQPVDGQSFVPLLHQQDALADRSIFWHYPLYLAGNAYNTVVPVYGTEQMYWRATPCSVVRNGDWKLIQYFESEAIELYNLRDDIGEKNDLSSSNPEKANLLLSELQAWQSKTHATIPSIANPDFDPTQ